MGYLWAPNWSLTYAILGPLGLCLMLEALKGTREALDSLFESEMVRDEADLLKVEGRHLSTESWFAGTGMRLGLILVCAAVVPALLAYPEWYAHNFVRLKAGMCGDCTPADYDWGLAAIIAGTGQSVNWRWNSAFDFLAFTCEAVLVGATVLSFLYLLDLREVVPGIGGRIDGCLLPNVRSNDPRRGFQKFEEALQLLLNACLTFFLVCYSIRINRIYMRSVGYSSLVDFIQRDINGLVKDKVVSLKGSELLSVLFGTPSEPNYQEFFGGVALLLIALFSLGVISLTVGRAARRAKYNAMAFYESQKAESLFGLPLEEEKDRIRKMTTWPLEWRYFQLDALLGIMGVALISLWYYRLGFYLVVVVTVTLVARFEKAVAA